MSFYLGGEGTKAGVLASVESQGKSNTDPALADVKAFVLDFIEKFMPGKQWGVQVQVSGHVTADPKYGTSNVEIKITEKHYLADPVEEVKEDTDVSDTSA